MAVASKSVFERFERGSWSVEIVNHVLCKWALLEKLGIFAGQPAGAVRVLFPSFHIY